MNLEIVKARNRGWGFLIGMEKLRVHFKSKDIFTFALVIIPRQPQWGYCGANENLNYFLGGREHSITSSATHSLSSVRDISPTVCPASCFRQTHLSFHD